MKKGFTLIELLAVIVILAIIALIATPIVLNIIKDSRESSGLRSAEMYLDAVEQAVSVEKMDNTKFNPNTCTITTEGNLDCDNTEGILEVKVNGDKPVNGKITFEKGKIKKATLEYKDDKVIVMNTEGKLQYQKYISISNYQHKHIDGTIEDHEVTFDENGHGICSICMEEVLIAGLYDENNNLVANWDSLVNNYGLNIENNGAGFGAPAYAQPEDSLTSILLNNEELSNGTKLIIGSGVSSIGVAQGVYTTLSEVIIPKGVTSIGKFAFSSCTNLTTIRISESVTSIAEYAFDGSTNLKKVYIDSIEAWCNASFQVNPLSIAKNLYVEGILVSELIIPEGVTNIGDSIFLNCTNITSVVIPDSVTSIGASAFSGCTGLTSVDLGKGVTSIGDAAFRGCTNLKTIDIPDSVTTFGEFVFEGCTELTTVNLGNGITSIGHTTFNGCKSLNTINFGKNITNIGFAAFSGCTSLKTIIIPDSVTSIGSNAFNGCTGLTNITIPSSVTSIGVSAFEGCTGLTSIEIPDSVTSIGSNAFDGCRSLTSVDLGKGVTSIGGNAFSGCINLTSIVVDEQNTIYDSRNNCNAIIETATNTLIIGCTTTTIPDSVTSIGSSAFSRCTGLTSITIPDSVTKINSQAFFNCTSLTSIYIPNTVNTILSSSNMSSPFYNCSSSLKIYTGVKEGEIPSGWGTYWNYYSRTGTLSATYGITREQYESIIGN